MTSRSKREHAKHQSRLLQAQQDFQEALHEEDALLPSRWDGLDLPQETSLTVLGVVRESRNGHDLKNQKKTLKRVVGESGHTLLQCFSAVEKGWRLDEEGRPSLFEAMKLAREKGCGLVSLDFSRYLRHQFDHTSRPTREQMNEFFELVRDIPIYTTNDIDAHPCFGEQYIRREMAVTKGTKVGAPRKREGRNERQERRKDAYLPLARKLREAGWNYSAIAREITRLSGFPISDNGIRKWLEN